MTSLRSVGLALLGLSGLTACSAILGSFDVSDTAATQNDGGPNALDAKADSEPDSGGPACANQLCLDPSSLKKCDGTTETCAFSCVTTGAPHCGVIQPSAPVLAADLAVAGAGDIEIGASTKFSTDTGAIENVRPANIDPLKSEVNGNIGFRLASDGQGHKVAVWSFRSLKIPTGVTVRFDANNAVAFVATNQIEIVGVVDVRGYAANMLCGGPSPGPGGGKGGGSSPTTDGDGPGGGKAPAAGSPSGGASGGAYSNVGGTGGAGSGGSLGGAASTVYGAPDIKPLLGGSGGGGTGGAAGGGGGGAIQLVAGTKIIVGGGANPGGVNAGGCNGHGAAFGQPGSAAGSGGAILVETPSLEMTANGALAANGGNGATGNAAADPQPGILSDANSFGAFGSGGYGNGGGGGTAISPKGQNGTAGSGAAGGSGGGSAGRIRINNRSASFTAPPGAVISPAFAGTPNAGASAGPLAIE